MSKNKLIDDKGMSSLKKKIKKENIGKKLTENVVSVS